jgi:CheY-like chemotaxis protein
MLEARGLDVDVVGSGRESLDYLKINLPDVIFMDFMMADMDGYEVTGMITANPETSSIPVIICTGHDTPQDRERARNSRARGFVTKPVDDATLDALLVQLRQGVATIAPVAPPPGAVPTPVATPTPVAARTPIADPTPVVVPAPVATPVPIRVSEVPATEDIARIVERTAREVWKDSYVKQPPLCPPGPSRRRRVAQAVASEVMPTRWLPGGRRLQTPMSVPSS